jgi:hypothetical protein
MKTVTRFLAALTVLVPVLATTASAQTPLTVREIIRVPQANLDQLQELGADATQEDVDDLITFEQAGETVQFTAVVLSDPYNSGLASWDDDANAPGRVHVFVRDTAAVSQGYEGMTVQLVDGSASILTMQPGFVYDIIGDVSEFNNVIQVAPVSFQSAGPFASLGLPDEIVAPVDVSTEDLNRVVGQDGDGNDLYQVNWVNFNDLNNQYVRIDEALVEASVAADAGRPNWQFSSSGTDVVVNADDISLRYRNDRNGGPGYPNPPYATREPGNPFVPPATGAVVEVQGFAALRAFDFDDDIAVSAMSIAPWEDEDLEVLESPPVFGGVEGPSDVPGDGPVTVSIPVSPSGDRTISSVVLSYEASTGESGDVPLTDDGAGVYSGEIPALPDGAFVTYFVTATDNTGAESVSEEAAYRVLYDGIDSIEDVQLTASLGAGASPFAGITTDNIDIEAVVMSNPEVSGFLTIQDDPALEAWTGVFVEITQAIAELGLAPGDVVQIDAATIGEDFGVTELQDATLSVVSTGGTPYAYKEVSTGVLAQDDATAEAHEGMALRFEDVTITDANADGPENPGPDDNNFGEWQFSSDGTEDNEVRADDVSDAIPQDFNVVNLTVGQELAAIQGIWSFSFGNYKLLPESPDDILFTVDAEGGALPDAFGLERAYPNPFTDETTVAYTLGEAGPVTLSVYDVLGREVATLVDGEQAAVRHEVTFDARGLAAGVYVLRLTAGDEVRTSRVTLVK